MDVVMTDERDQERRTAPDATRPHHPAGRLGRLRSAARHALPALAGYLAVRLIGLLTLHLWAHNVGKGTGALLAKSDGAWYLGIAQHGYDGYERVQSNMAFFPLYPGLVRVLEPLSPLCARNTALVVAWVAALAAAWALFAIGDHLYDRRVGIMFAVLWGVLPHSIVQSMSYSEGIFTAFAAWSLYALLRARWVTAGVLCLLAGLTRPTASALLAVVCLAALIAVVRRRDGWRPWAALLLAPAGWLGYLAWVGWRTGRPDGWFHIQDEGWGTTFDFGADTARVAQKVLGHPSALTLYVVTLVVLLAIALFVLSLLDRQPWQLLLYSGLLLVTTLGAAGYYHAKARFLLPAFPLLLPVAVTLARAGWARAVTVLATLTVVSAYFGGHLLIIWTYSP
ncbi:Mannosyltransferase (PIG-V) [Micromonospora rhizosphaerae]|uniref:Mannosyltransferase (PIG-V) n=1 Tax=Micromonospora rhizosphaerae TaxID=568872 RepID=A0A1C6S323_9ACTN|nr:mannosyltransferase family protein [Micromonospora rhizosphaerae]SCL23877.1 Mannosyltransferase (PIG-V) [Micromonospora rhizosphaerae]